MVRWRHFHSSSESLSKYRKEIHRNVARKFCYRMVEFILMKFNSRQSWSICTSRVSDHSPGCSMLLVLSSHPVTFSTKCFCEYPKFFIFNAKICDSWKYYDTIAAPYSVIFHSPLVCLPSVAFLWQREIAGIRLIYVKYLMEKLKCAFLSSLESEGHWTSG